MLHIIYGLMARSHASRLEGSGFRSQAVDWIARQTFCFSQRLQANSGVVHEIRPLPLLSTSFSICWISAKHPTLCGQSCWLHCFVLGLPLNL